MVWEHEKKPLITKFLPVFAFLASKEGVYFIVVEYAKGADCIDQ